MKITNCAYAACGALRKSASAGWQAAAAACFVQLGSMLHCHCMWLHNRCSTFRAWLHGRGSRGGQAEAATMISTTSKPIRSCNIFTEAERETDCDASLRPSLFSLLSLLSCLPPSAPAQLFVPSHSCAEKHSLKQINTLRIVSF